MRARCTLKIDETFFDEVQKKNIMFRKTVFVSWKRINKINNTARVVEIITFIILVHRKMYEETLLILYRGRRDDLITVSSYPTKGFWS